MTAPTILQESFLELTLELKGATDNRMGAINMFKARTHFHPLASQALRVESKAAGVEIYILPNEPICQPDVNFLRGCNMHNSHKVFHLYQ